MENQEIGMHDAERARYLDELRLAGHLFTAVKDGLTGSSVLEVIGSMPSDILHAGVLLPQSEEMAASLADTTPTGLTDPAEAGSAATMGVDFQWSPDETCADTLSITVTPRISLYYAVVPTWEEATAMAAHGQPQRAEAEEGADDSAGAGENNSDEQDESATAGSIEADPEGHALPRLAAQPRQGAIASTGDHELPLKFRRWDVRLAPVRLDVDVRELPGAASVSLQPEMATAANEIAVSDPDYCWSTEPLRVPASALESPEAYRRAVESLGQSGASLPQWRARIEAHALEETVGSGGRSLIRVHVALINDTVQTRAERRSLRQAALFSCGFDVALCGGETVPFEFVGTPADYRVGRRFDALGTNCIAEVEQGRIRTETVPLYRQPWLRTTERLEARFQMMGSQCADPLQPLQRVAAAMQEYLAEWDAFTADREHTWDAAGLEACRRDRDAFAAERQTLLLGVQCLERDHRLLRAFQLMNDCFQAQGANRGITAWRLFQLVYIVSQLPSVAARELEPTADDDWARALHAVQERVDVLLFPTGGGKTEAYLGLIVLSLFFDRLRGKVRGVSAWMRFPLRMLSLQQLDRLAAVIAQAEQIRSSLPELQGVDNDPFAIGYYVGSGNTPNRMTSDSAERIDRHGYAPVFARCPFCCSQVRMQMDRQQWRLKHVCANAVCYSNTSQALGDLQGSLPVHIVDNEIYRYRPSVLVGTVDKLAILAYHKNFSQLIREVEGRCPRHGYFSYGCCIEREGRGVCDVHRNRYERNLPRERDPGPSLIIQDEMHLLSEELGTFNGHYEGFLRYVARRLGHLPPKLLGATATIQAFERHIFHLYLARANRFPVPGWREGETFYSTCTPLRDRRLYAGVLSHRRTADEAVISCLTLYQRAVRELAADPAGAIARLGLTTFTTPEELREYLHLYDFSLAYVNRKATGGDVQFGLERHLARAGLGTQDMQRTEDQLDRSLLSGSLQANNTLAEVRAVIDRIERERHDTGEDRLDILIATSLISHGVDLERINMMCLAGMPSRHAEYVQASSRSARNHVGLVFGCFNRRDLRECAQYHYFSINHRFLDRLVEPVPINRFSTFAADKTVPGLLCGLLLCFDSREHLQGNPTGRDYDDLPTLRAAIDADRVQSDALREALEEIILGDGQGIPVATREQTRRAIQEQFAVSWQRARAEYRYNRLRDAVGAISSFRDVDRTVEFVPDGSAAVLERL
jgi:hypothetical protein